MNTAATEVQGSDPMMAGMCQCNQCLMLANEDKARRARIVALTADMDDECELCGITHA